MTRHVCIVSNTLADGGAERWASNTCNYLTGQFDLKVSLVLFRDEKTYPCADSVVVRFLHHCHFAHSFRTVRQLRQILRRDQFDAVISNGAYTGQFVGQAVRGTSAQWIARISGNIAQGQQNLLQRWGWRWLDYNIKGATTIVANSVRLTQETQSRWPGIAERVITVPNGVDVKYLLSASAQSQKMSELKKIQRPVLLAGGRLNSVKRPDVFLRTVQLLQQNFDVEAYWCGDGPLRSDTERLIRELGLENRVRIVGFQRDLPSWMRRADCFVMTSDHEGSPNVLSEAMAIGLPVVSTNCDHGPGELLANERGWLASVGDADSIAEAVSEVLTNPQQAQYRASNAQRWVQENLDLSSIGNRWKELIEDCCQFPPRQCVPSLRGNQ